MSDLNDASSTSEWQNKIETIVETDAAVLNKYTGQLATYTRWLVVATGASVIAAIFTFICTLWLAISTQDLRDFAAQQAKDMHEQLRFTGETIAVSNNQAAAAREANEIARRALDHTVEAAVQTTRAYLLFTDLKVGNDLKYDMPLTMILKNTGPTPSYNSIYFVGYQFVDFPFSDAQSAPDIIGFSSTDLQGAKVFPSQYELQLPGEWMKKMTDDDAAKFKTGRRIFLIEALARYTDVAGTSHRTELCVYFRSHLKFFLNCPNHNEAN